jgi:pseudaminic acid cytidylyltransferase
MTMAIHNTLAVIPARGGSKRIPRKNIRLFLGKPIIHYAIEAARRTEIFSDIIVSTDDNEIAEIAKQGGAAVPFFRSQKSSDDFSTISDVLKEVMNNYSEIGKHFDYFCCILPTAPLILSSDIILGLKYLLETKADSVVPVVHYSHPIQRALKITDNTLHFFWPENKMVRTNDLEASYHDAGSFYWIRKSSFEQQGQIFMENSIALEISEEIVQDIDNETDWRLAELKYQLMMNKTVK